MAMCRRAWRIFQRELHWNIIKSWKRRWQSLLWPAGSRIRSNYKKLKCLIQALHEILSGCLHTSAEQQFLLENLLQEILEHQSKRQIELELMKFRETMEERGYSEDVIETKVEEVRKKLTNQVRYYILVHLWVLCGLSF